MSSIIARSLTYTVKNKLTYRILRVLEINTTELVAGRAISHEKYEEQSRLESSALVHGEELS